MIPTKSPALSRIESWPSVKGFITFLLMMVCVVMFVYSAVGVNVIELLP